MIKKLGDMPFYSSAVNKINEIIDHINNQEKSNPPTDTDVRSAQPIKPGILVPDEIEFTAGDGWITMGLNFGRQILAYHLLKKVRCVEPRTGGRLVKCKLVPCKAKALQAGDWFVLDKRHRTEPESYWLFTHRDQVRHSWFVAEEYGKEIRQSCCPNETEGYKVVPV